MSQPVPDPALPIAVFDSGVGGLTVLHECLVSLPEEDYLYLGDDARFPYGAKSADELRECVERNTRFLLERGAKLIVIACNSAAGAGLDAAREIAAEHGVEVVAVIEPEAEIAAAITDSGRVGVLATPATVDGGAYLRALSRAASRAHRDRGRRARPRGDHPARLPVLGGGGREGALLLRAAAPRRGRHGDPRLHPLPAGGADAAALPRPRGAPGHRRPRARRDGAADPREPRAGERRRTARATTASSAPATPDSFRELGTRFLQMPLGDVELVELPD